MSIQSNELIKYFEDFVCPICRDRIVPGGFTTWFRVEPKSAQSLHADGAGKKALYEQKIKAEIAKNNYQMVGSADGTKHPLNVFDPNNVYGKGTRYMDVCIGLFFGLSPTCKDKDVDNMAKLFLDALKGPNGLLSDDKVITHLEVIKRELISEPPSSPDNYLVGVRVSMVSSSIGRKVPFTWNASMPVIEQVV
jgi:hypothetical protein